MWICKGEPDKRGQSDVDDTHCRPLSKAVSQGAGDAPVMRCSDVAGEHKAPAGDQRSTRLIRSGERILLVNLRFNKETATRASAIYIFRAGGLAGAGPG